MIRIGIVDDHAVVRTGLRQCFALHPDTRVVGEASNGREAVKLARREAMDVIILDLAMPGAGGDDVLAMIRAKAPCANILILSGYPEEHFALNLLRRGARGYLNKDCAPEHIVRAVRALATGQRFITPTVADLIARKLGQDWQCLPHALLTHREFQVFLKLAKGETLSVIATALSISVRTVGGHRNSLLEKMGLKTNSDLTYYAMKHRLLN